MNEIWLIRHGETEWSRTGQHTGRTNLPLTAQGRERAADLVPLLGPQNFSQLWTSPLQRAQETAALAGFPSAQACPDLMEWDYGELEGRTTLEIQQEYPDWSIWDGPIPGGETIEQVAGRAQKVLARCEEGCTALFAHGHILRVLAACWLRLDPREGRLLALSTASISVLGWEHETRVLRSWNQVANS